MNIADLFKNDPSARDFASGEVLLKQGEPNDKMYVVTDGEVEVIVDEQPLVLLARGDIFGELSLVDHGATSADIVAKTAGQVVPVDEKRFMFLVQQTPFFAVHVMKMLAKKIRMMNERPGLI